MLELVPLISAVVAFFVFMFAVFKWYSHVTAEREKLKEEAVNAKHADLTKILDEHKNEFILINASIQKVEQELITTRDELHRDYAKVGQVDALRRELKDDFDKVFKRLSTISADLNQIIGKISNGQ